MKMDSRYFLAIAMSLGASKSHSKWDPYLMPSDSTGKCGLEKPFRSEKRDFLQGRNDAAFIGRDGLRDRWILGNRFAWSNACHGEINRNYWEKIRRAESYELGKFPLLVSFYELKFSLDENDSSDIDTNSFLGYWGGAWFPGAIRVDSSVNIVFDENLVFSNLRKHADRITIKFPDGPVSIPLNGSASWTPKVVGGVSFPVDVLVDGKHIPCGHIWMEVVR